MFTQKKILLILFIAYSIVSNTLNAQDQSAKIDSLRVVGNYNQELKYRKLIYINNPTDVSNVYNMACCYSLLKNADSSFYYLNEAISLGHTDGDILEDYDLKNIHSDIRWAIIETKIERIYKENNSTINNQLGWELSKMFWVDQAPKAAMDIVLKRYGMKSPEMDSLDKIVAITDSLNMLKLEKIINQYGFPKKDLVGATGTDRVFTIIVHAPLSYQKKYFHLVEEAISNGDIRKQSLAYLTDKILTKEGKKQLYGTQLKYVIETGGYIFKPIEDEKNVDTRRKSVGLEPIEEYAKNFGIEYKK